MAAAHKKSGEIYNKAKNNVARRNNRSVYNTEGSEVGAIIGSIKQYRGGQKNSDGRSQYSKRSISQNVVGKDNRNSSVKKPNSRMSTENYFAESSKGFAKKFNGPDKDPYKKLVGGSGSYAEKRRYHSSIRGHESFPYDSVFGDHAVHKPPTCVGDSTAALERTAGHGRNERSCSELDPKSATSQLTELGRMYADTKYMSNTSNLAVNSRISSKNGSSNSRSSKNYSLSTKPVVIPKSFSNAAQFSEYMQETTKTSDKTISRTKNQYLTDSIPILTQLDQVAGSQEGQSVEDMHDYFVALYQKSKSVLKEVEKGGKKSAKRSGGEPNVIPVEESEADSYC
eukprot:TRINITY_DN365_c0_g1_i14.p1 TRINITY_DN365_c0_g1~~TRINITY_DN365_c0_g1_i14.p1  ORF type:complete len:340 (+),score=89.89 TRINITY_DN365_c0_g1_i14:421-1440(+)